MCCHFTTLRDEAVFRLTLEGFRIDEVLSMKLSDYDSVKQLIQPTRSKRKIRGIYRESEPFAGSGASGTIMYSSELLH